MRAHEPWPELPWRDWEATITTLHMWVQIVGKVRLALAAPLNHWWLFGWGRPGRLGPRDPGARDAPRSAPATVLEHVEVGGAVGGTDR